MSIKEIILIQRGRVYQVMKPAEVFKINIFKEMENICKEAKYLPLEKGIINSIASPKKGINDALSFITNYNNELINVINPVNKKNIHKASQSEIASLDMISNKIAEKIVNNMEFKSFQEIQDKTAGIGDKKIIRLANEFTFADQLHNKDNIQQKIRAYRKELNVKFKEIKELSNITKEDNQYKQSSFQNDNWVEDLIIDLTEEIKEIINRFIYETNYLNN